MPTLLRAVLLLPALGVLGSGPGAGSCWRPQSDDPAPALSGIHPHLSVWNQENECGIGAVVPWAGSLWLVTYAPHAPRGSSDRLYQVTPELVQHVRPESVGGTPANRLVHRETRQLVLGPYVIDAEGGVRVVGYERMPGRPTGTARHLTEPATKVYTATMEEGLYELDLGTLEVVEVFADGNGSGRESERYAGRDLPGYHGKGLYAGQGRLVYANNGDHDPRVVEDPTTPSGALAEWRAGDARWSLVLREQFTEVTGPGGIHGNSHPETDPVWSLGWDHRSVLLALLDGGEWSYFRLPKASHAYDGAHGWNTEWPRIRAIGEGERLLATMHGTFWGFPRGFARGSTEGVRPRSSYLKVVGDFCRWGEWVVLGCDDVPRSAFLNERPQKAAGTQAAQSHSNLWFLAPDELDRLGPVLGRGSVWSGDDVAAGSASLPYLFAGYDRRVLHLVHAGAESLDVALEVDRRGNGEWEPLERVTVPARGARTVVFDRAERGEWIRLRPATDAVALTASFLFGGDDARGPRPASRFDGLATAATERRLDGTLWNPGGDRRTLAVAVGRDEGAALYELTLGLELVPSDDAALLARTQAAAQHAGGVTELPYAWAWEERGRRWLFPRRPSSVEEGGAASPPVAPRLVREVVTERDLLHLDGTFYELPSENAGGVAFVRPIATHALVLDDFASFAGLFVLTGVDASALEDGHPHLVASADGRAAVWAGALDDLWSLGRPRGVGGPWGATAVLAGEPSDPYLLTGFDLEAVTVSHEGAPRATITLQVDIDGRGTWIDLHTVVLGDGASATYAFPADFAAYWLRAVSDVATTATVTVSTH